MRSSGSKLQDHRQKRGLTQAEAAALIGVHMLTWASWESGKKEPSRAHRVWLYRWSGGVVDPNSFIDLPDDVAAPAPGPLGNIRARLVASRDVTA